MQGWAVVLVDEHGVGDLGKGGGIVVDVGHLHCYGVLGCEPGCAQVRDSDGDVVFSYALSVQCSIRF